MRSDLGQVLPYRLVADRVTYRRSTPALARRLGRGRCGSIWPEPGQGLRCTHRGISDIPLDSGCASKPFHIGGSAGKECSCILLKICFNRFSVGVCGLGLPCPNQDLPRLHLRTPHPSSTESCCARVPKSCLEDCLKACRV